MKNSIPVSDIFSSKTFANHEDISSDFVFFPFWSHYSRSFTPFMWTTAFREIKKIVGDDKVDWEDVFIGLNAWGLSQGDNGSHIISPETVRVTTLFGGLLMKKETLWRTKIVDIRMIALFNRKLLDKAVSMSYNPSDDHLNRDIFMRELDELRGKG